MDSRAAPATARLARSCPSTSSSAGRGRWPARCRFRPRWSWCRRRSAPPRGRRSLHTRRSVDLVGVVRARVYSQRVPFKPRRSICMGAGGHATSPGPASAVLGPATATRPTPADCTIRPDFLDSCEINHSAGPGAIRRLSQSTGTENMLMVDRSQQRRSQDESRATS
jgi:hypothetical protein